MRGWCKGTLIRIGADIKFVMGAVAPPLLLELHSFPEWFVFVAQILFWPHYAFLFCLKVPQSDFEFFFVT